MRRLHVQAPGGSPAQAGLASLLVGNDRRRTKSRQAEPAASPEVLPPSALARQGASVRRAPPVRTIPLRRLGSSGGPGGFLSDRPVVPWRCVLAVFRSAVDVSTAVFDVQRPGPGHASPPSSVDVPLPDVRNLPVTWPEGFCSGGAHGVRPFAGLIRRTNGGPLSRSSGPTCLWAHCHLDDLVEGRPTRKTGVTHNPNGSVDRRHCAVASGTCLRPQAVLCRACRSASADPALGFGFLCQVCVASRRDCFQPHAAHELRRADPGCPIAWHESHSDCGNLSSPVLQRHTGLINWPCRSDRSQSPPAPDQTTRPIGGLSAWLPV
jgi:hypothetical protein